MVKYDAKAARENDRSYLNPEIVNQRLKTIEAMALRVGEKVLDAGCGTGLLTEMIASQVGKQGQVTGLDYSQDMLDVAATRCDPLGNIDLHQGSVTSLEFADNSFDAASCIQTLLYVDDVETAITELYRVIKPGGRIAVLETDWRGAVISSSDHALTRTLVETWDATVSSPNLPPILTPLLRSAGFNAIQVQAIPILNTSYIGTNYGAGMIKLLAKNAVKRKVVEQEEADRWLQQIKELAAEQGFLFCVNRFLFTAVK